MSRVVALLCVFALASAVRAASVPQTSADKYYFSRPNGTNAIQGRVIGSPPAYNVLRREDIAWLREAYCERAALKSRDWRGLAETSVLAPRFGPFPLSHSNTFHRYTTGVFWENGNRVTNIVVGYNYVTNAGSGIDSAFAEWTGISLKIRVDDEPGLTNTGHDSAGFLATNDALWADANIMYGTGYPAQTDIVTTVTTSYPSYYIEGGRIVYNTKTNMSTYTMTMTNGTVNVYTNIWIENKPQVIETVSTNVSLSYSPGLMFRSKVIEGYTMPQPQDIRSGGILMMSAITNYYAWLAGARRLADCNVGFTNSPKRVQRDWDEYGIEDESNSYHSNGYGCSVHGSSSYYNWYYKEDDQWHPDSYSSYSGDYEYFSPMSFNAQFASQFSWDVIHAGGANRIKSATLYVVVHTEHMLRASSFKDTTDYDGIYKTFYTNQQAMAAFKLGQMTERGTNSLGKIMFEYSVDLRDIAESALGMAGYEFPSLGFHPSFYFDPPAASVDDDRSLDGSADTAEEFKAEIDTFHIVYDLAPSASLPGWNN